MPLLDLLKKYGWNATSFQVVETDFSYWFDADGDAAVAYLDTGGAWVVAGAPIAEIERSAIVAERFAADAFAGGHIFRFALRAVFRAPSPVLFLLGAALIPWTGILATAETKRWFRTRREQYGWVAFDAVMACVLLSLSHKWRPRLAIAACGAAAADGLLTSVSAARYSARRARNITDVLVIAAAIAAPLTAAAILFGGLRARTS
ncbi:MAG TPA: hypothetical protein VGJ82_10945 [Thermoanaerobaculia bacterium]|jgi:hypothetical protein